MRLRTAACISALTLVPACGGPRQVATFADAPDSTHAEWGDEHLGLVLDEEVDDDRRASFAADGVFGETRVVSARGSYRGASARVRATESTPSGAVEWKGSGTLRHAVAGVVRPTVGEGALLADRRDDAQLHARPSPTVPGLRLAPSTLVWGTSIGAGVSMAIEPIVVSVGGWSVRDDPSTRALWTSLEWSMRRTTAGVCVGAWRAASLEGRRSALSVFAGHHAEAGWVSAEAGVTRGAMRALVRAVVGERHQWRAVVAAGATPADGILTPSARWGGAIERHDAWAAVSSRSAFLVSTRRRSDTEAHRRRVEWSGAWRVGRRVGLELAARFTRDEETSAAAGPFVVPASFSRDDDLRARVSLSTHDTFSPVLAVDNQYRLEVIRDAGGSAGLVATWVGRLRAGAFDARVRASALALRGGQVAYVSNAGLLGTSAFTATSASGTGVSASVRVALGPHAGLGAQASRSGHADTTLRGFASLAF
jgi:hypothetical protein